MSVLQFIISIRVFSLDGALRKTNSLLILRSMGGVTLNWKARLVLCALASSTGLKLEKQVQARNDRMWSCCWSEAFEPISLNSLIAFNLIE